MARSHNSSTPSLRMSHCLILGLLCLAGVLSAAPSPLPVPIRKLVTSSNRNSPMLSSNRTGPVHVPLTRSKRYYDDSKTVEENAQRVAAKYGIPKPVQKRSLGHQLDPRRLILVTVTVTEGDPEATPVNVNAVAQQTQLAAGEVSQNLGNEYQNNGSYTGSMMIEGKPFTMKFDTGSCDIWIPDQLCTGPYCAGKQLYDPAASKTSKKLDGNFSVTYGTGAVAGDIYTDTVSIGDINVQGQMFGAANTISHDFNQVKYAGIFGLAFPSLSSMNPKSGHTLPWFWNAIQSGAITDKRFGVSLNPGKEVFSFAGIDETAFKGDITFAPVTSKDTFWQIEADIAGANGVNLPKDLSYVIDTGSNYIFGPLEWVRKLVATTPVVQELVDETGSHFIFDCVRDPGVTVKVNGKSIPMSVKSLTLEKYTLANGTQFCIFGVYPLELPFIILGDVFLQNTYAVFDVGNKQVGFADFA